MRLHSHVFIACALIVVTFAFPHEFDAATEARTAITDLLQQGQDNSACSDLAAALTKEIIDSVAVQQKILDGLDTGAGCATTNQHDVDAAQSRLDNANKAAADAETSAASAASAGVKFSPRSFSSLTEGECSSFFSDPGYTAAMALSEKAKTAVIEATSDVTSAELALTNAQKVQTEAVKQCQCSVRTNYNEAWAAANTNNDQNTKSYTKGKHMMCVLSGTAATDCKVGPVPAAKPITLANGVPEKIFDACQKDDQNEDYSPPHQEVIKKPENQECLSQLSKEDIAAGTTVTGTVLNIETKQGESGAKVTYVSNTGHATSVTTDSNGQYTKLVPRCSYWTTFVEKEGFSKQTAKGRCTEPKMANGEHMMVSHGIGPILPKGQMRAVLNWQANEKYLKDLDLHLLIPGQRDVNLKKYAATDLSVHDMPKDEAIGIFWDRKGSKDAYPYTVYEMDHGSVEGVPIGGGPEAIRVFKELPKQYLFSVDCWSCDEYEGSDFGVDHHRVLTKQALTEFYTQSFATVILYRGDEQVQCSNIASASGHPTTLWDSMLVETVSGSEEMRKVTPVNQFNIDSPTIKDATFPGMKAAKPAPEITIPGLGDAKTSVSTTDWSGTTWQLRK